MAVEAADPSLEFSAHRAAYYVAIESADAAAARASLGRMQEIAAQFGEPRLRWICTVFEVFEATMEARLADAEQLSGTVLEIGTEIGEPDAFMLYAAQLFVNRSFAGRYDEVIPLLEAALANTPDALPFRLAFAISCAAVGREDEARTILHEGAAAGVANLPLDFLWMTTVIGYAVLAIELQERAVAAELYPIIEPFGDQVAFNGATSQGYIGAYLGKLASLLGRHDLADAHLRRALEVNISFGWKYHEATTLVALALSQRRRSGAARRARAGVAGRSRGHRRRPRAGHRHRPGRADPSLSRPVTRRCNGASGGCPHAGPAGSNTGVTDAPEEER